MTTPRPYAVVSGTATLILSLALAACAGTPARSSLASPVPLGESAQEAGAPLSIRFDNQARDHVHVYLVGQRREWLLGRVEPGAVASLRIPDGALDETGFVQLAVIAGGGVTQQAARSARAQLTIAQTAAELASRRWRLVQGQLTAFGVPGAVAGGRAW